MSLFEQCESMLDHLFDFTGEVCDYTRGENTITSIACKPGSTHARVEQYGVSFRMHLADFIVRTNDIDSVFPPKIGDVITYNKKQYVVTSPPEEPHWQYHSRHSDKFLRIHTNLLEGDNNE